MERIVDMMDVFPIYGYERNSLISKEKGCLTIPLRLELPEVFTLDQRDYNALNGLFFNIIDILGPNMILHRQDHFFEERYGPIPQRLNGDFMEIGNERYFEERPFLRAEHYLFISLVPTGYYKYGPTRVNSFLSKKRDFFLDRTIPKEFLDRDLLLDFEAKVESVSNLLNGSGLIRSEVMGYDALLHEGGLYAKYFSLSASNKNLPDIDFSNNSIKIGEKQARFFTVENLDQFTKEYLGPYELYGKFTTQHNRFPVGNLFSIGFKIPHEHIINQYIYIPEQEKALKGLRKKAKRFDQFGNGKKDDSNGIYADQIREFNTDILENHKEIVFYHLNVLGFNNTDRNHGKMCSAVADGFKKLKINAKENNIDRKNLFFAGIPGNAVGLPSDMYMPMSSDMAASLVYFEGGYRDGSQGIDGLRLIDRVCGRPLSVSVYREPERNHWIFNRGMLIASGSGGGKSYVANHYIASELRQGAEAIIIEDGNSYERITMVFGGTIIEHDDKRPFTFNPFKLDSYDTIEKDDGSRALTEGKVLNLVTLLKLITGDDRGVFGDTMSNEVKNTVLENLLPGYYSHMWETGNTDFRFDSFYEYCQEHLKVLVGAKRISKEVFDPDVFLFLLEKYYKGGPRERLLNREDERIARLGEERLVYFKLGKLIDNELLFPITALMVMEIFDKKLLDKDKLPINKMMVVDEAWKALSRKEFEDYFNSQSRMARKYGGQPIFISQKVDDFIASEVIKNAIVVNSHIKVFLDMGDFENAFEDIQEMMGLSEKQRQSILSLNRDLPLDRKYREVAFCWKDRVKVYGVETSLVEKCIYETNPMESHKINELHKKNHNNWELTAKDYSLLPSQKTQEK
ncbi:TraG family conjugative transposon ATPase [Flagellimonas hadalis]|uniref:TraG family conjugative transposon ATPase n=1 Tax=Flagellimonas hadalis TaxID=2597517 RepID=A0A5N5INK9_9FLAO|nr:TraG family conjugative transposon ATPase [Allomuricauda hadalis]KAB5484232.1 TraG family conjugative transposon ATPase [Allomuricauda hadalis]